MEENEKKGQPEVLNPAHKLAKRLQENRQSLHIARVPDNTKKAFILLAEKEFCGDYGMTLKWLIDDIPNQDTRMIVAKLQEHEGRIDALESSATPSEEEDENTRKMLSGKKISVRGSKKNG